MSAEAKAEAEPNGVGHLEASPDRSAGSHFGSVILQWRNARTSAARSRGVSHRVRTERSGDRRIDSRFATSSCAKTSSIRRPILPNASHFPERQINVFVGSLGPKSYRRQALGNDDGHDFLSGTASGHRLNQSLRFTLRGNSEDVDRITNIRPAMKQAPSPRGLRRDKEDGHHGCGEATIVRFCSYAAETCRAARGWPRTGARSSAQAI
jgi:hypothetical protein